MAKLRVCFNTAPSMATDFESGLVVAGVRLLFDMRFFMAFDRSYSAFSLSTERTEHGYLLN